MNDLHARLRRKLLDIIENMSTHLEMSYTVRAAFVVAFRALRRHDDVSGFKRGTFPIDTVLSATMAAFPGDAQIEGNLAELARLYNAETEDTILVEGNRVLISLSPAHMTKLGRALVAMATGKAKYCGHNIVGGEYAAQFSLVNYHDYDAKREAGSIDMSKGLTRALYNLLWHLRELADDRHDTDLRSHCVAALDHLARSSRHDEQRPCYDHRSLAAAVFAATYAAGLNGGAASCGHAILAVVEACRAFDPPEPPLPENVALAQTGT